MHAMKFHLLQIIKSDDLLVFLSILYNTGFGSNSGTMLVQYWYVLVLGTDILYALCTEYQFAVGMVLYCSVAGGMVRYGKPSNISTPKKKKNSYLTILSTLIARNQGVISDP